MKKYLLVSLTILFAAAFVWAEEAAPATPSVDVKADATLSWGIDLGKDAISGKNIKHGFKNEASFSVKFPLIKKGDKVSAKTDAPVYGQVNLKDIELNILSKKGNEGFRLAGDVGKIDAKLFFYGAYLTVFNKPSFKSNYAQIWEPVEKDKEYDDGAYTIKPGFNGMGTKLGYANKNFMGLDVGLKLGSNGNWEANVNKDINKGYWKYFDGETALGDDEYIDARVADVEVKPTVETETIGGKTVVKDVKVEKEVIYTASYGPGQYPPEGNYFVTYFKKGNGKAQGHSKYGIGVDFSIKPLDKMLAIDLTVNSTLDKGYTDKSSLAFGVKVTSEPIEGLNLTAAFDGGKDFVAGAAFVWDALVSAEYKWLSGGVYVYSPYTKSSWNKSAPLHALAGKNKKGDRITDLAFFLQFATKADKKEASHLIDGLDAGAHLGIYRLLTFAGKADDKMQLPMVFKLWGAYKIGLQDASWIKPFATVWGQTDYYYNSSEPSVFALAYNLGVTYSPVEKVQVTAKWEHGTKQKNFYTWGVETPAGFGKDGYHNGRFTLALKVIY